MDAIEKEIETLNNILSNTQGVNKKLENSILSFIKIARAELSKKECIIADLRAQ